MTITLKHIYIILWLAIGGCVQGNRLDHVNSYAGNSQLVWSEAVQCGGLRFAVASTRVEGELFWVLAVQNHSQEQVTIPSLPYHYEGGFAHNDQATEGAFAGGMHTRLTVSVTPIKHRPPLFDPYDVRILRPRESVITWISLGSEPNVTALKDLTISYIDHHGNGFPIASFTGTLTIPWVPLSEGHHGWWP